MVGELLLGADISGLAATVARVAGVALVGLGLACWPGPPRLGMLVYGAGIGLYLAWLGVTGAANGVLLWPAVALHLLVSALIGIGWARSAQRTG